MRKVTERVASAFVNGVATKQGNTEVVVGADSINLLLHGNRIAWTSDKGLVMHACGWRTPITKERLNG